MSALPVSKVGEAHPGQKASTGAVCG